MLPNILIPVGIFVGLGLISGVLLSIFSKIFAVKIDERITKVREVLPGLNCGVCGFSGCDSYAKEIVNNGVEANKCIPGGDSTSKKISEILEINYQNVTEAIAYVKCDGKIPKATNDSYTYQGEPTCAACDMYYKGKGLCDFGCIGYGDCIKSCSFDAIKIIDGIAEIDPETCKGCSMCVATCPKNLIEIRDAVHKVYVRCSSCDKGKITIDKCNNGCIGCKKCEKVCPSDAITVENGLASIDYNKCTSCGLCVKACPKNCIEEI